MQSIDTPDILAPRNRAKNIPIETIIDLRKKNLSIDQIAKIVGCNKSNIWARLEQVGYTPQTLDQFTTNRADIFAFVQSKLLNSLDADAIQKMQPYQRVIALSVLYDKERLERGKSTEIIDITHTISSINELSEREKILEAEYKVLRDKGLT